jgi:hypothetical protein
METGDTQSVAGDENVVPIGPDEQVDFDPCDLDVFIAEIHRRYRADEVTAFSEHGIPAFFATRQRYLFGRTLAVASGVLAFSVGMSLLTVFSGVGQNSGVTGVSVAFMVGGVFAIVVASWMLAMRLTPHRPILMHLNLDPDAPDAIIAPISRYRWGRTRLAVIGRDQQPLGYLIREDDSKYSWTATHPNRLISFRLSGQRGSPVGLIFLSFLIPPVGWALMISRLATRSSTALTVVNGTGKMRYGTIRPSGGLKGEMLIDMTDDPSRYAHRPLLLAAALVAVMHR